MDTSTEEALKAIITGIATAGVTGDSLIESIAQSLSVSSSINRDAADPVTAADLARLALWAGRKE